MLSYDYFDNIDENMHVNHNEMLHIYIHTYIHTYIYLVKYPVAQYV